MESVNIFRNILLDVWDESNGNSSTAAGLFFEKFFRSGNQNNLHQHVSDVINEIDSHTLPTMTLQWNDGSIDVLVNAGLMYSDQCVFLTPSIHVSSDWDNDAGVYCLSPIAGIDKYFDIIEKNIDLVKSGYFLPLPYSFDIDSNDGQGFRSHGIGQEIHMKTDVTIGEDDFSRNIVGNRDLNHYAPQVSSNILFPTISSHVDHRAILEIRDKYQVELFHYLKSVKKLLNTTDSENKFQSLINEIDDRVIELNMKFSNEASKSKFRRIEVFAHCIVATCLIWSPIPIPKELLYLVSGSNIGSKAYDYFVKNHQAKENMKNSPYYIPWKVSQLS